MTTSPLLALLAQANGFGSFGDNGFLGFAAAAAFLVFLALIVLGAWRSIRAYRSGRPVGRSAGPLRGIRAGDPPAPGWYDDPTGVAPLRWWDGSTWTDRTDVRGDR